MIDNITNWYQALPLLEQIYWGCAIVSSLVFIIQFSLTLIGMDSSDIEVDFDAGETMDLGGGMSLFSFRALINFIVGFGWSGVCLRHSIGNDLLLIIVSVGIGFLFAWIFLLLWKKVRNLESNGAFRYEDCIGLTATVYLRIPASKSGQGKVQISRGGSVHELAAVTLGQAIPTGASVKVTEIINKTLLVVEPL